MSHKCPTETKIYKFIDQNFNGFDKFAVKEVFKIALNNTKFSTSVLYFPYETLTPHGYVDHNFDNMEWKFL